MSDDDAFKIIPPYAAFFAEATEPGSYQEHIAALRDNSANIETKTEESGLARGLRKMLASLGLDFQVDAWALEGWKHIRQTRGSWPTTPEWHEPGPGWTWAVDVALRWQKPFTHLADTLPNSQLPIYMLNKQNSQPVKINDRLGQYPRLNPYSEIVQFQKSPAWKPKIAMPGLGMRPDQIPEAFWLLVPLFWWLQDDELEFYEKSTGQQRFDSEGNELPLTKDWLSSRQVLDRLPGLTLRKLEDRVRDMELRVYYLSSSDGVYCRSESSLSGGHGGLFGGVSLLDGCLFKSNDVTYFAKKHPSWRKRKKPKTMRERDLERACALYKSIQRTARTLPRDVSSRLTFTKEYLADIIHATLNFDSHSKLDSFDDAKWSFVKSLVREKFEKQYKPSTVLAMLREGVKQAPGRPPTRTD